MLHDVKEKSKFVVTTGLIVAACVSIFASGVFPRLGERQEPGTDGWIGLASAITEDINYANRIVFGQKTPLVQCEKTGPSDVDVRLLADRSANLNDREIAVTGLAANSLDQVVASLLASIANNDGEDPYLRALAARILTGCESNAGKSLIKGLAPGSSAETVVARGIVRGIADRENVEALADLLFDTALPVSVRIEAARGLARINSPSATRTLFQATYSDIDTDHLEPVFREVLRELAGEKFGSAKSFVDKLIYHGEIDNDSKLAAIEGLASARNEGAIEALLVHATNPDQDIREAATWAISVHPDTGALHDELMRLLLEEPTARVRANIYDALLMQRGMRTDDLRGMVMEEASGPARMAGLNLIAKHMVREPDPELKSHVVPELRRIATEDSSLSNRLGAIIALGRVQNHKEAAAALHQMARESADPETRLAAELAIR